MTRFLGTRVRILLASIFLALFSLAETTSLDAGGWGKTANTYQLEATTWNGVYFDMNGLHFSASVPNYDGTTLQNNNVTLRGFAESDTGYVITTGFNANFNPPKTAEEFAKMVQDANPKYIVTLIDGKKLGAKFAVDLTPISPETKAFWRYLSTKDRLITMGVQDSNENRRFNFFESIYIH